MIFGITGQTGSGKSSVSEIFRSFGADVIDADKISREVCTAGSECLKEIEESFGSEIIIEDGELDRRRLGGIVFSDPQKLELLTGITHRYIKDAVIDRIKNSKSGICTIDGAVLIGSNMEELCEYMVAVIADEDLRKKRIMARDGLSEDEALRRIRAQRDESFYRAHSDYIIENNGSTETLEESARRIYDRIVRKGQ